MPVQRLFSRPGRRHARLLAVVAAVLLAEAVWFSADLVLGLRVQAPAGTGSPEPMDLGPLIVALASLVLSLLGWGLLATLERLTRHARRVWLVVALVALVASLGGPLGGTGVSGADRAVLVLMHVAVAAVVVPVLFRTSSTHLARSIQRPSAVAHGRAA